MFSKRFSIQSRIFIAMLLVILLASAMIIIVAIWQYREQAIDYHKARLERKENAIKRDIIYLLESTAFFLESGNPSTITQKKINEISEVHKLKIDLYNLEGKLLKTSHPEDHDILESNLNSGLLEALKTSPEQRLVFDKDYNGEIYKSSYSYITDINGAPIGIIHIPYLEKSEFYKKELNEFLTSILVVFLIIILVAVVLAYLLSRFISKSLKQVSEKMKETGLNRTNEKIDIKGGSEEIHHLVEAYNNMIDQLDASAVKLAQSEREYAWREMAKQVAHEIKNPLTPMRLSVQNFQRRFDPNASDAKEKLSEFSHSIIQQIDTMNSIATAFSDFAKMPVAKKENLDLVGLTKHAVEIFTEPYISFHADNKQIQIKADKNQIVRIITNLLTNALHATSDVENPIIEVKIKENQKDVVLSVSDNGKGIPEEVRDKVFEPKFTTKSSGMGLGLSMVKNIIQAYGGGIDFISEVEKGTVFKVTLPK